MFFHGELPFADCTIDRGTPCVLFAIKYHAWNHVCRDEIVISRYVNELLAIGLAWRTYLDVSQRLTSNEIRYRHIYMSENRYCSTQCFEFLSTGLVVTPINDVTRCTSYIQRFPALARHQPRKPATRISINVHILLCCHQTLVKKPKLPARRLTAIKIHRTKLQILPGIVGPKISEEKSSQDGIHTPFLLFTINSVLVK